MPTLTPMPRLGMFLILLFAGLLGSRSAFGQAAPPIPAGDIRIHYFRPDGVYTGWTLYAFFDTTEPNNFPGGPVQVTGRDSFGTYFDVGVAANAQNVGIILHSGDTKDPGPNQSVDPATQGREFWELSGSDTLLTSSPHRYRPHPSTWQGAHSLLPARRQLRQLGPVCVLRDHGPRQRFLRDQRPVCGV